MSGLPAGALDALLSPDGGTAAFDAAIQADRDATQKMFDDAETRAEEAGPVLARNHYNQTKLDAATKDTPPPKNLPATNAALDGAKMDLTDASHDDLIALSGLNLPPLPTPVKDNLDRDAMDNYMAWGVQNGIDSRTLTDAFMFFVDEIISHEGVRDDAEGEFRRAMKGRLTDAQIALLIRFVREEVMTAENGWTDKTKGGR